MNNTLENGTFPYCLPYLTDPTLPNAVCSINLVLAVPINSYVLWLILRGAGGGTLASEFFYINLTVLVIIFSLASVFHFGMLLTHNAIFCTALTFFTMAFFFSALLLLCCICVERFVGVVHPVVFLRYKRLRYRVACCCAVWLVALAFTLLYMWSKTEYIFIGFGIVCISVVSFSCLSVLRALRQPGPGEGQRDGAGDGKYMKERAFRIILFSLIVMLGTIGIYIVHAVLFTLLTPLNLVSPLSVALQITYTISMMAGFVYPLLYIHKVGKLPCFKVALNAG